MIREIVWRIDWYDEVDSTNDVVYKRALDGEEEGLVVVANSQTKGRGRLNRPWFSPKGENVYMSVLLVPSKDKVGLIPFICGLAVSDALEGFGLETKLKWPNDLVVADKKIGGILCEYKDRGFVIAGVGVNLNIAASEFPKELLGLATSFLIETKRAVNRDDFVKTFLTFLKLWYIKPHFDVVGETKRRCATLGRRIRVILVNREIEGLACDIDERGALLVRTSSEIVRLEAGDVVHLR